MFWNCKIVQTPQLDDEYGKGFDSEMYKKAIDLLNGLLTGKAKLGTALKDQTTLEKKQMI